MSDTNSSSGHVERLARRSRQAALIGIGGLLLLLLSLGFGYYELGELKSEIRELKSTKTVLEDSIKQERKRLSKLREDVDSLRVLKENLYEGIRESDPALAEKLLKRAIDSARAVARRPTVWIQVGSRAQRDRAEKIAELLRRPGLRAPGIETVATEKQPSNYEIRIFQPSNLELAELIRKVLRKEGYTFEIQDLSDQYDVRASTIEIWFPAPDPSTNKNGV